MGSWDHRDSSDDEEVKLLSHRKGADEPDPPGADIRDVPEASDTQQTNGCPRRSLFRGLARSGISRGDLQWYLTRRGSWT